MRLKIIRLVILLSLVLLAGELFFVQILRGQHFYRLSVNNRIRVIPLEGYRGRILDRNGEILADNRLAFHVALIPQDIQDSEQIFDFLSGVLRIEKTKLLRKFYQKRLTPFAPVVVAEDVDKRVAMILEENKFRFPGLYVQEDVRRQYPFREAGAHLLGYVGKINRNRMEKLRGYGYSPLSIIGYSGVEEYYDEYLKGEQGGQQIEVNNRGKQVRLLSIREPEQGKSVMLTVDARIQSIAQEALVGRRGAIIIMNYDNGEILGLVSAPGYDPNVFTSGQQRHEARSLMMDSEAPLLNRAIKGQYPPGSVFKAIVSIAGMVSQKISPYTTFHCPGFLSLGRRRFRCAHVHGQQDLVQGLAHSCNVYFFNVGLLLGPDVLNKYARMFGLGSPTEIDLPFEERGFVPSRRHRKSKGEGWYKGDTLNYAIGQGELLVTPMQLVRMMTTIGRSGRQVQPHLLKAIGDKEVVTPAGRHLRMKSEIFATLQQGLQQAIQDPAGTARLLQMPGFAISGKTGTAQSIPDHEDHAWFVGYDLASSPRIAFCVFLEFGGSSYNAVSMTRDILKRLREEQLI